MKIPNLTLGNEFWCHTHTPEFGFWGEAREMVRENMTLEESYLYQEQNFGFFGTDDQDVSIQHRLAHIILIVLCECEPSLKKLLPSINSKTGFLEQSGYNGFLNGEMYVFALEGFVERLPIVGANQNFDSVVKQATYNKFWPESSRFQEIGALNYDFFSWYLAHISDKPVSIAEIKKGLGWDNTTIAEKANSIKSTSDITREHDRYSEGKNRWGEINKKTDVPSLEEIEAILPKLEKLYDLLFEQKYPNHESAIEAFKSMRIRDLYILIAGEQVAHNFFKKCGVQEDAFKRQNRIEFHAS